MNERGEPEMVQQDETYTRRQYLLAKSIARGVAWTEAVEKVTAKLAEHPEWDAEERKTYRDWGAQGA